MTGGKAAGAPDVRGVLPGGARVGAGPMWSAVASAWLDVWAGRDPPSAGGLRALDPSVRGLVEPRFAG